jgi:hypothetical protein
MVKIEWKRHLMTAIPVTAAVWFIGFLMSKLNLGAVSQLYTSIPATSGITPTLGAKGLAILGGLVPLNFTIPAILVLFLSAFVTLIIGSLVVDSLFKGKTLRLISPDAGRLMTYIALGASVGYLIFVGLKVPSMLTMLGFAIHTVAVALVAGLFAKLTKWKV